MSTSCVDGVFLFLIRICQLVHPMWQYIAYGNPLKVESYNVFPRMQSGPTHVAFQETYNYIVLTPVILLVVVPQEISGCYIYCSQLIVLLVLLPVVHFMSMLEWLNVSQ